MLWPTRLIVNELGIKPVTYTYDWGMVTDLGRQNISRMSSQLGVENIIVADNISKAPEHSSQPIGVVEGSSFRYDGLTHCWR